MSTEAEILARPHPKHDPAILAECCKEASARLMRTVSIIQRAIAETPLANATSQVETK